MPSLLTPREDFSLVLGPDRKLYVIGGYNNKLYITLLINF
jgi:hypothetical protein